MIKHSLFLRKKAFLLTLIFTGIVSVVFWAPRSFAIVNNLVPNAGFENQSTTSPVPTDWIRGRWGINTATFTYPAPSSDASRAVKVTMSARTTGDAKWAFSPIPVTPGHLYEFRNDYSADVPTVVTLQILLTNGMYRYTDIAFPGATSGWTSQSIQFTAPADAASISVFHLLNRVGSLTIDNVVMTDLTPPVPINPILNPSLETVNAANLPANWPRGKWGSHDAIIIQ